MDCTDRQVSREEGESFAKGYLSNHYFHLLFHSYDFILIVVLYSYLSASVFSSIPDHNFNFFECSAKTGENVDEAFVGTSRIILKRAQETPVCIDLFFFTLYYSYTPIPNATLQLHSKHKQILIHPQLIHRRPPLKQPKVVVAHVDHSNHHFAFIVRLLISLIHFTNVISISLCIVHCLFFFFLAESGLFFNFCNHNIFLGHTFETSFNENERCLNQLIVNHFLKISQLSGSRL